MERLIEQFTPLARKYAKKYSYLIAKDDLIQIVNEAIIRAYKHFDEGKGNLNAFILTCIQNAIIAVIKEEVENRMRQINNNESRNETELENISDIDEFDYIETKEQVEQIYRIINSLSGGLTQTERKVLLLSLLGCSTLEISEQLGKTRGAVRMAKSRGIKKIRQFLNKKNGGSIRKK